MARLLSPPALRPFLPADTAALAAIFHESVEQLTGDDYSEAQQAEWSAIADDEAAFGHKLARQLTLLASFTGPPLAFASLKGSDELDMLYVHPAMARRGLGTALCDALERLAAARGATRLRAEASDTARPFFERRGYAAQRRGTRPLGEEWLGVTMMHKPLGAAR